MKLNKKEVTETLCNLLDDCLASANQEHSYNVLSVDLKRMKLTVEFDIVVFEDDNYIGFAGY